LPLRRRTALPWLFVLSVLTASLLPALGSLAPEREWPLTLALPGLAALLFSWRRLGIVQWKNAFAVAALVGVSLQLLQMLPALGERLATAVVARPAAPLADEQQIAAAIPEPPPVHYAGLLAALMLTLLLGTIDRWRLARTTAMHSPRRGAAVKALRPRS
jgi:hypothetical protein